MDFNLKKYYYKFYDTAKYKDYKSNKLEKSIKIFEEKKIIYGIERKIKDNKKSLSSILVI